MLSPQERALLHSSFERLTTEVTPGSSFGPAFYARVFARMPEARSLFGDDLEGQGMKFLSTLRLVLDAADDPEKVEPIMAHLADGHAAMGIAAAHYPPMGAALIETMQEVTEEGLTIEEEVAWTRAFDAMAARMLSPD